MARIRTIKPDFFLDEELAALPVLARLLFIGLWVHADREGRLEDRPARIRAQVFPYEPKADVDALLDLLAAERAGRPGFVVRYSVGGRDLIQISSFLDHQRPNAREPLSSLPGPEEDGAHARTCKHVHADARTLGKGKGKGREGEGERPLSGLAAAQPDRDRGFGVSGTEDPDEAPPPTQSPDRPLTELEWRVEETWRAHLAQWRGFYLDTNGRVPIREPTLTDEIRKAIRAAIREYDGHLLGKELRPRWVEESKARAAGIGIFLDPWCSGNARDNDARSGGKRYLEHWRPWARQRGKQSPVDRFAELYFEAKSLGPGAVVAPQPPARTDIPETEEAHAYVA